MTDLILLAAGASRRFGSQKLLADFRGKPLYRWAFETAAQVNDTRVLVVTRAGLLDTAAAQFGFEIVLVEENLPQSASVAAGAKAARPGANRCCFVCDQPHFTGAALDDFVRGFQNSGKSLGRVKAGEKFGSPTIFSPKFRPDLLALTGDRGARELFRGREEDTFIMEVPEEFLLDYDTPWPGCVRENAQ